MRLAFSLFRVSGFGLTVPLACCLGVGGALLSHDAARLPTIRLAIPPSVLIPFVAVLLLSWTLHDRLPDATRTAVRSPGLVAVGRLVATTITCSVPAAIDAPRWGSAEPIAVTVIGVALTSLASTVLGNRVWLVVLAGGYAWLRHAAVLPPGAALGHEAAVALLASGIATAVLLARQR